MEAQQDAATNSTNADINNADATAQQAVDPSASNGGQIVQMPLNAYLSMMVQAQVDKQKEEIEAGILAKLHQLHANTSEDSQQREKRGDVPDRGKRLIKKRPAEDSKLGSTGSSPTKRPRPDVTERDSTGDDEVEEEEEVSETERDRDDDKISLPDPDLGNDLMDILDEAEEAEDDVFSMHQYITDMLSEALKKDEVSDPIRQ